MAPVSILLVASTISSTADAAVLSTELQHTVTVLNLIEVSS
jgi:hypothetical protein